MKKMIIIKIIMSAIFIMILTFAMNFIFDNPIISNYIAMGQMSNSDEAFLLMEYYNRAKTIVPIVYGCIVALIVGTTGYNIYNIIKNKGEN